MGGAGLTPAEIRRYARHLALAEIGEAGQSPAEDTRGPGGRAGRHGPAVVGMETPFPGVGSEGFLGIGKRRSGKRPLDRASAGSEILRGGKSQARFFA